MSTLPITPEQAQARVDAYRGGKATSKAVVEFTREVVRDSLHVAPQPVTKAWISYSTSVIGLLAARSEEQGLPLDRTVVLDRARIDRFLAHECKHLTTQARSGYRSRLDIVAGGLLGEQNASAWPRPVLSASDAVAPWDDRTSLWADAFTNSINTANRSAPAGLDFTVRRARNTWLVRHLTAGTPLPLLMEQAGLTTTMHLQDLLRFVQTADPASAAATMRGI